MGRLSAVGCLCLVAPAACAVAPDPAKSVEEAERRWVCMRWVEVAGGCDGFRAEVDDENWGAGSLPSVDLVDCAEGGRLEGLECVGMGFGLILRYFLIVGVSGSVNLANVMNKSCA